MKAGSARPGEVVVGADLVERILAGGYPEPIERTNAAAAADTRDPLGAACQLFPAIERLSGSGHATIGNTLTSAAAYSVPPF